MVTTNTLKQNTLDAAPDVSSALSVNVFTAPGKVMVGERPDPVLILCKAAGFSWPTVKALFLARPDRKAISNEAFDEAFANYGHLSASTAQRVVRFWQARRLQ